MNSDPELSDGSLSFINLPRSSPGVVVLLSGGLDSAVMAGLTLEEGVPIWPLYVRQGFLWEAEEMNAVRRFLASLDEPTPLLNPLSVAVLSAPSGFAVGWAVDDNHLPPHVDTPDEDVYLPGRNLALLTQASMLAYSVGVNRIQLGILASNPFPDATPSFFQALERTVFEAMRWPVSIETPLAHMNKVEIIQRGISFDLANTISCARPRDGIHCGLCSKCSERYRAFRRAGLEDPARYANEIRA